MQMALVGYELEQQRLAARIREIQLQLSAGTAASGGVESEAAPKKRPLSAAARKRIAAALRKRWAEHRTRLAAGKA
jgi:hypothetical protein